MERLRTVNDEIRARALIFKFLQGALVQQQQIIQQGAYYFNNK